MIIDTHVHILSPDQHAYPRQLPLEVPPQFGWVRCDFSAESLLAAMDEAGIGRALVVQTYNAYRSDNRYAADMAERHPGRFSLVCCQDPREENAQAKLTHWVRDRGAVALRIMCQERDSSFRIDDLRVLRLLGRARDLGIPACLFMWFEQVPRVQALARRFPDLPIALDHMGSPPIEEGPPYASLAPLFDLADSPNVSLKFSSSTIYRSMKGASTPEAFFSRVLERFGPGRLAWGSNFPMNNERSVAGLLELAREQLRFLSPGDLEQVFGGTAGSLWLRKPGG